MKRLSSSKNEKSSKKSRISISDEVKKQFKNVEKQYKDALQQSFVINWQILQENDCQKVLFILKDLISIWIEEKSRSTPSSHIIIGINKVTREFERGNLLLCGVAKKDTPSPIIYHLPVLSKLHSIPLLVFPINSYELGSHFGIQSVITFGILKDDTSDIIQLLSSWLYIPDIPWLSNDFYINKPIICGRKHFTSNLHQI